MKTKLIVVAGPTASGKTGLGIEIAKAVDGEIISADSMQIYKNMSVATAAPTKEEREQAPHHLTEILEMSESFSVSDFCRLAGEAVKDITERGKVPIIVGGTGLFIDSFVDNIRFTETKTDSALRESLMKKSADELYNELCAVDLDAAKDIHKNNKKRVARALEIYYSSGKTKSFQNENSRLEETPYEALYFVIGFNDREKLYQRINRRVDTMLENGLVDEARYCLSQERANSAQAIGHKELKPYLDGEASLEEAAENLKRETRRYAKRQITWFRRRKDAVWLYADDENVDIVQTAINKSREFLSYGKKS